MLTRSTAPVVTFWGRHECAIIAWFILSTTLRYLETHILPKYKRLPNLPIFPQIPLWLVEWHQTRALIEIVHVHMNIQRIAAARLMTAERARRG